MELPTIRHLECLLAVAQTLNFRQAAEACYITQPALSAQIQQLETLLGVRLFERDRRRVLPTAAGELMVRRAADLLAELHDLTEAVSGLKDPLSGNLRIGVIPTVAPYLLPLALGEVSRSYPNLRVLLREDQTGTLLRCLAEGSIDVAIMALEVDLGDTNTLPLFDDPFYLAVPCEHRLGKRKRAKEEDLVAEEVLLLEDGHCLRDQALSVCQHVGANEVGDFRATSLTTLVQMVAGGVGVTLIPKMALALEAPPERGLTLIPFAGKGPSRTIGLVWRKSSSREHEFSLLGEAILQGMANSNDGAQAN